jgi:hypothetical protein
MTGRDVLVHPMIGPIYGLLFVVQDCTREKQ